jgi:hypothetical protein
VLRVVLFALLAFALAPYPKLLSYTDPLPDRCGFLQTDNLARIQAVRSGAILERTRPDLPEFVESADTRFRVHFTRTGPDAVPATDADGSGTPDFVEAALDALAYAWRVYADTMGYIPPPTDGVEGGSGALDVYLRDLSKAGPAGAGQYGITITETMVSSRPPERYTSWMELDNDFSADDRNASGNPVYATTGVQGLLVSCSHELHHVFQVGSYGVTGVQLMVYELTSTWMELRTYPNIPDWLNYAKRLFEIPAVWPLSDPSNFSGYVWAFFGNVLHEQGGDAVLIRTWENLAASGAPMQSLVKACTDYGPPLGTRLSTNLGLFYHTGSRAVADAVVPFTDSLPEIQLVADEQAKPPSMLQHGDLRAMEIRAMRYALPAANGGEDVSTAIVITWSDDAAFVRADANERKSYTVTVTDAPLPTDILVAGTTWGIGVEPAEIAVWVDGSLIQRIQAPYPNPVVLHSTREVYVPVPDARAGDEVEISLLTTNFMGLQSTMAEVVLDGNRLAVPFTVDADLAPGTYLLRCVHGGQASLSKIVVQR